MAMTKGKLGGLASLAAVAVLSLFLSVVVAPSASAQQAWFFDEFRIGGFMHDVESMNGENDIDLNAEILFRPLRERQGRGFTDILLSPRPHLGATVNFGGDTSEYYAGLTWDVPLGDFLFVEGFFGGAVHDGNMDRYGCRLNFHEGLTIGANITERLRVLATIDHMSNANLCGGQKNNEGLTNAGVRFGYKLN